MSSRWSTPEPAKPGFYPRPAWNLRLLGLLGILGGLLWPVSILVIAGATQDCTTATCDIDRGSLAIIGVAPLAFAFTVVGLELRAPRAPGMGDLVGDLTIGVAAALFVLSFLLGSIGFLGPGLLLLLIGSIVFGVTGYRNGARTRLASIIVAIGAGTVLFFLLIGAVNGFGDGLETPWLFGLLLYSIGWMWLGATLILARPLPIPLPPPPRDS